MPILNLTNLQQFTAVQFNSDPGAVGGPVVIPQCAEIGIIWLLDSGKQGRSILHGRYSGGYAGTVAQANSIMTALSTGAQWTALAAFLAASPTGIGGITLRDLNAPNQPILQSGVSGANGSSASPALPNEMAVTITLRTGQVGRAFRGRIYVPGWATNALGAGNVVAAGAVTALGNWANTIPTALAAQGYTFVIGQRKRLAYQGSTGVQHAARDATTVAITSQIVRDNHWDSQRRRGLK